MCFIPETLPRIVIINAAKEHKSSDPTELVVMEERVNVLREMRFVTSMAFRIMLTEPIVTFLGIYNGFAYGLLFLYLDGVFDVFVVNNGLSYVLPVHPVDKLRSLMRTGISMRTSRILISWSASL